MTLAQKQRAQLCDLFDELGPFAPTLCGDWQTQDLAAHLWIREHRPTALPGIAIERFAGRTAQIQQHALHSLGFPELVRQLRSPAGLMRILDPLANAAEYTIHHMDVLKPAGRALRLEDGEQKFLWRHVRMMARGARPGLRVVIESRDASLTSGSGGQTVHLLGDPSELLYYFSGRTADADLTIIGEPEAIEKLAVSVKGL